MQNSYNEAIKEGGQGTPFILIMVGSDSVALQGDQPYDSMRAAVDAVIAELPGRRSLKHHLVLLGLDHSTVASERADGLSSTLRPFLEPLPISGCCRLTHSKSSLPVCT